MAPNKRPGPGANKRRGWGRTKWHNHTMTWILCYDIEDDGLRQKLARLLEKEGWERLQKSVFAAGLSQDGFYGFYGKMEAQTGALLKPGDKIYAWRLSDAEFKNSLAMGEPFDARWIQGGYSAMYLGDEILLK